MTSENSGEIRAPGDQQVTTGKVNIEKIIGEGWKNVSGTKLVYFVGTLSIFVVHLLLGGFSHTFLRPLFGATIITVIIENVLVAVAVAPLVAGLIMLGVKRSQNKDVEVGDIFKYLPLFIPLAILSLMVSASVALGMMILVLPGIYLAVTLSLAVPILIDQKMTPLQAYTTSFRVVNKNFFSVLAILAICLVAVIGGALLLLVGLLWAIPFVYNTVGGLYSSLFPVKTV